MEEYLKRRIIHAERRLLGYKEKESLSIHGHFSRGYWEGMATAYENALYKLKEEKANS